MPTAPTRIKSTPALLVTVTFLVVTLVRDRLTSLEKRISCKSVSWCVCEALECDFLFVLRHKSARALTLLPSYYLPRP